jgi:hypothetical protein
MNAPTQPALAVDAAALEGLLQERELIRAVVNTLMLAVKAQCAENDPNFEMLLRRFASDPLTQVIDRLRVRGNGGSQP